MGEARLSIVVEGEVKLVRIENSQSKKSAKDKLGPGRLLGESALYGEPYSHYAVCSSNIVKLLSIRVIDFFEKLLQVKAAPLDKPLVCAGTIENRIKETEEASDVNDALERSQETLRRSRNFVQQRHREAMISHDASVVKTQEWKTVPSKEMLNWRQPPACRPHKCVAGRDEISLDSPTPLDYPRDFDLFPSVQRSVLAAQRVGSMETASTSAPSPAVSSFALSGMDSLFASLDDQIKRKLADAEELEVEHFMHTSMGVCVEDVDRPRSVTPIASRPPGPPMPARPKSRAGGERRFARPTRNAVLLSCGGVTSPGRDACV